MKKAITLLFVFLITPLFVQANVATDADLLKEKLARFSQINAQFSQLVSSAEGKLLNESKGLLTVSQPGKFRWQVTMPEEELIVSDGKTMWIYSPFIEQVTILNLSDAIAGTPFQLLSGANDSQWANYSVKQDANRFTVADRNPQGQNNTFIFEFNATDNISKFIVIEEQGQKSEFTLTHQPLSQHLSAADFDFKIPAGVEIDDQR